MLAASYTCVGLFRDRGQADAAIDELHSIGFDRESISVVTRGREGQDRFTGWDDDDRFVSREPGVTAGEGAAVGGLTGLLIGAGMMLIPGIGPILAVGPIAAGLAGALTGVAAGAVTGGIAGGLMDLGISDEDASYYESGVGSGSFLVTVNCLGRTDQVRDIMQRHGAERISDGGSGRYAATTSTTDADEWERVMPQYRSDWEARYSGRGGHWGDWEEGYRFGWDMARHPAYRDQSWAMAEPSLRREWALRHKDTPWERAAHTIRDAWESATSRMSQTNETYPGHDSMTGQSDYSRHDPLA